LGSAPACTPVLLALAKQVCFFSAFPDRTSVVRSLAFRERTTCTCTQTAAVFLWVDPLCMNRNSLERSRQGARRPSKVRLFFCSRFSIGRLWSGPVLFGTGPHAPKVRTALAFIKLVQRLSGRVRRQHFQRGASAPAAAPIRSGWWVGIIR